MGEMGGGDKMKVAVWGRRGPRWAAIGDHGRLRQQCNYNAYMQVS